MTQEDLIERFDAILEKLGGPVLPLEATLWDSGEVARYFRRSLNVARESLMSQPSFPKAIRLPSRGRAQPLYNAGEVVEWAKRYREKH